MKMHRLGKRLGLGLLALTAAITATGWYAATHESGHQHFESCRVLNDGMLVLDYGYGAGDKVTASVDPRAPEITVSLQLDGDSGPNPAIALYGQLRFDTFGGLRGRPVKHMDGTVLPCRDEGPKPNSETR